MRKKKFFLTVVGILQDVKTLRDMDLYILKKDRKELIGLVLICLSTLILKEKLKFFILVIIELALIQNICGLGLKLITFEIWIEREDAIKLIFSEKEMADRNLQKNKYLTLSSKERKKFQ